MNTRCQPEDLAATLLRRSVCAVQVAAVLVDRWGVHAWGWNHAGANGYGEHAECHCLRRANRDRLPFSTLYIAARRQRNGRAVTARPCPACQRVIEGVGGVVYRDSNGVWCTFK